ncbi:MAG: efflux RND transporter periplasmic adaptor subunit [Burkholderiales bacterium]|nr:efflux RND transporter periplasmic adaptor subunit [Burkholderiales bacterium]
MLSFVRRRWLVSTLVLVAVATAAFAAVKGLRPAAKKENAPVTLEFVSTDLTQAENRSIAQRLPLSGTLQPRDQAVVKARIGGDVKLALVREGESVRAGQLLAQLDSPDLRAKLAEKQANLDAGRAQLAIAEKNRATNQALLKQGFISQNAYDNVESTMNIQRETVKSWEAQVAMARNALADAQAVAPIAGIVARQHARTGEKVAVDAPLYTLVNLRQMELQAMVPGADIGAVQLGAAVRFTVDGFEGKSFAGRVERINPTAEPGSRTVTVYIAVPNPDLLLRGGSFASGALDLVASAPRPTLPLSAIRSENGQSFVWLIQDGKLARRTVVLGRRDEAAGLVQLAEALPAAAPVVAARVDGLREGNPAVLKIAAVAAQTPPPAKE